MKTLKPGERESKLEVESTVRRVEQCIKCWKMCICGFEKEKVFVKAMLLVVLTAKRKQRQALTA